MTNCSLGYDAETAMSLGARTSSDLELGSSADLLSRRRASASVEEIRNLYSALQELVPVPSVNQPVNGAENEVEQRHPEREAAKPNVLQIPNENCLQVQQPRKRLLPTPPGSPRMSHKSRQAPRNDAHGNGAKDHGRQSPGPARRSLQGDVELEVSKKGSHLASSEFALRRRSTGNCLSPDSADQSTPEFVNPEEKSRKVKLSPFVKRKLLSPFSRRRGSTPNLVIVNTDEQPTLKPKYSSEKSALRSPLVSRRESLSEAISLLAKSDSIEALLKERDRKYSARGGSSGASRGRSKKNLGRLEDHQMELLLNSLEELQDAAGTAGQGSTPTDSEIIQRLEERRGSLGTEMRELLDALKELSETNSRGPNSPASSVGEPSSRRSSFHDCVTPTQRESLDSLEAYFNEKLRDATKAKVHPNASDVHPNVFDMPPNVTDCHVFDDDKEETDGAKMKRADTPPATTTTGHEEKMEVSRSLRSSESGSRKAEAQPGRTQRRKEQREFALQVNDKLEEWLTRATALSTKDKTDSAVVEGENGHETGGKSSAKRKIFSKRSFKRQRQKSKEVYRTRRSQSLHDVFADEEPANILDQQREEPVKQADKIPVSGLSVSVSRSKSMQDVTNVKKKRQCKRYASHETSNTKACLNVGNTTATHGSVESKSHNHGQDHVPVASHAGKQARKPRILPKDPVTTRKPSEEPTASMQRKSSGEGSAAHAQRRRSSRLPTDLPLFYCPSGTASADQHDCSSSQSLEEASYKERSTSTPDIKKSLFPHANKRHSANFDQLCGANQELFFVNKDSASGTSSRSSTSCVSHFAVDVNNGHLQNSRFNSRAMPLFYKENSRETQPLQHGASHDSLADYSDDYRDGTRSESDDSGCPGNEFNGNEIAVQTEPLSQFHERERARENNERLDSRTLRRLRSSARHSREVSDLGVTV